VIRECYFLVKQSLAYLGFGGCYDGK
jgi:hypothetical protein